MTHWIGTLNLPISKRNLRVCIRLKCSFQRRISQRNAEEKFLKNLFFSLINESFRPLTGRLLAATSRSGTSIDFPSSDRLCFDSGLLDVMNMQTNEFKTAQTTLGERIVKAARMAAMKHQQIFGSAMADSSMLAARGQVAPVGGADRMRITEDPTQTQPSIGARDAEHRSRAPRAAIAAALGAMAEGAD